MSYVEDEPIEQQAVEVVEEAVADEDAVPVAELLSHHDKRAVTSLQVAIGNNNTFVNCQKKQNF